MRTLSILFVFLLGFSCRFSHAQDVNFEYHLGKNYTLSTPYQQNFKSFLDNERSQIMSAAASLYFPEVIHKSEWISLIDARYPNYINRQASCEFISKLLS